MSNDRLPERHQDVWRKLLWARTPHCTWHAMLGEPLTAPEVQVDDGVAGQLRELLRRPQQVAPVAAAPVGWRRAHVPQVRAVLFAQPEGDRLISPSLAADLVPHRCRRHPHGHSLGCKVARASPASPHTFCSCIWVQDHCC